MQAQCLLCKTLIFFCHVCFVIVTVGVGSAMWPRRSSRRACRASAARAGSRAMCRTPSQVINVVFSEFGAVVHGFRYTYSQKTVSRNTTCSFMPHLFVSDEFSSAITFFSHHDRHAQRNFRRGARLLFHLQRKLSRGR